jgi:hypothetical protein
VRLVVEIQRIGEKFVVVNVGRERFVETAAAATISAIAAATVIATAASMVAARSPAAAWTAVTATARTVATAVGAPVRARSTAAAWTAIARSPIFARRPRGRFLLLLLLLRFRFFRHEESLLCFGAFGGGEPCPF